MTARLSSIDKLNRHPVNQLTRKFLRQLHQSPDPLRLYALQLAIYGLEKWKLTGPWAQDQDILLNLAEALEPQIGPAAALAYLGQREEGRKGTDLELLAETLSAMTPHEAGMFLIENLYENLRPHNPALNPFSGL